MESLSETSQFRRQAERIAFIWFASVAPFSFPNALPLLVSPANGGGAAVNVEILSANAARSGVAAEEFTYLEGVERASAKGLNWVETYLP